MVSFKFSVTGMLLEVFSACGFKFLLYSAEFIS
jgi:hypothetical protein